jgi:ubiquinone/menaquinone biosynthesis C-methylase UbiE
MSEQRSAREVFGQRAAYYTTSAVHADPQGLARLVEWALQDLAVDPSQVTALDLATGTGHTALALAPHVRAVIGLDVTPEMLAEAHKLCEARGVSNAHWLVGDVLRLPFRNPRFALLTCRRAAHHFRYIERACREMRRMLARGGRLVIEDRSVPEDDFTAHFMNTLDCLHDASHVLEYSPSAWRAMLERRGFAVQRMEQRIQHRPISSLTDNASAEEVRVIHALLGILDDAQRRILDLREVDGELHINHWYVMIAAQAI